jgi:preprotein translocase subunit SecD
VGVGGVIVGVGMEVGVDTGVIVGERVVEAVRLREMLRPVSHVPVSKA